MDIDGSPRHQWRTASADSLLTFADAAYQQTKSFPRVSSWTIPIPSCSICIKESDCIEDRVSIGFFLPKALLQPSIYLLLYHGGICWTTSSTSLNSKEY